MVQYAKVVDGKVAICNEHGATSYTIYPCEGRAIFVDLNPIDGRVLITTDTGKVLIYGSNGGGCSVRFQSGSTNKTIVLARWQGNDIFTQNSDGSCILRSAIGTEIRRL